MLHVRTVAILILLASAAAPAHAQVTTMATIDYTCRGADFASLHPALSADGQFVAFTTAARNLLPGDTRYGPNRTLTVDLLIRDRLTGTFTRASVAADGGEPDGDCLGPLALSADGSVVAFVSNAGNLLSPPTVLGRRQVYVRDLVAGTTSMVSVDSVGTPADADSYFPSLSADARYVAFTSNATNLVPGDTNGMSDVFVHDRVTGATSRVSVDSAGMQTSGSATARISADGRYVAFWSFASTLVAGDTNGLPDTFVHDRVTGVTSRVSVDSIGVEATGGSGEPDISADGRLVVFVSNAANLVPSDTNGQNDVFVHDRLTGITTRVSVASGGSEGNGHSIEAHISADGSTVVFVSQADDLVAGDTNARDDAFVHDLGTGQTTRVSVDSGGGEADGSSHEPALSADGRIAAFSSNATNLAPEDANLSTTDIFVRERDCSGGCAPACTYVLCDGGIPIARPTITLKRLGGPPAGDGDEQLVFKGRLVFPPGVPASFDPRVTGVQLVVEDVPSVGTGQTYMVFDLSNATTPVPPVGGECGLGDGWQVNASQTRFTYKNTSDALPPACLPGSARRLGKLVLDDKRATAGDIRFTATVKSAHLLAPFGPLHGTIVLGATAADGAAGLCGAHAFATADCESRAGGKTFLCR